MDEFDEYGQDEGSDLENWETEQVFRDREHEDGADEDDDPWDDEDDLPYDEEHAAEMRAEYAMEAVLLPEE